MSHPEHLLPVEISSDPRWKVVGRIADSQCFRRSILLRDFLLYVAEQGLSGHPEEITEQNIGHHVYRRREDYSPMDDNIVRVSARRLRNKLREFYETEGKEEPWIVEIPKGGYTPLFQEREAPQSAAIFPVVQQKAQEPVEQTRRTSRYWLAVALVFIATLIYGWFRVSRPTAALFNAKVEPNLITSLFHGSEGTVQVVLSDPSLVLMQTLSGHHYTMDEYATQSYRRLPPELIDNPRAERTWAVLATRQIANLGDIGAASRIRDTFSMPAREQVAILRSAQNMHARDFRSGNFIVLGSSTSNPWAQMFNQNFNFLFETVPSSGQVFIQNKQPTKGEQSIYSEGPDDGRGYAHIALVPNLTNTGWVLLIAGLSMESTESAADFCLDSDSTLALLHALQASKTGKPPFFEAVLSTSREGGTGVKGKLVSFRVFAPPGE
jgi:hypothetical protein